MPYIIATALLVLMVTPRAGARTNERVQRIAPEEWSTNGRDYAETHYSPLDQIHTGNVNRLDLAWAGGIGQPMTYALDGVQYVTVMAGRGGREPSQVWTFTLD